MLFDEHEHGFSQKRTYQTVQKIKNYFMLSQYQNLGSISLLGGQFYGFGIKWSLCYHISVGTWLISPNKKTLGY